MTSESIETISDNLMKAGEPTFWDGIGDKQGFRPDDLENSQDPKYDMTMGMKADGIEDRDLSVEQLKKNIENGVHLTALMMLFPATGATVGFGVLFQEQTSKKHLSNIGALDLITGVATLGVMVATQQDRNLMLETVMLPLYRVLGSIGLSLTCTIAREGLRQVRESRELKDK
jgi:hypothetical protein